MIETSEKNQDIVNILTNVYIFIKRYFIILLVFLIAGIALGIYKKYTSSFYYTKHIIFNSRVVPNLISLDLIKSLQLYINSGDINGLAEKLAIPEEAASTLSVIDTGSFKSKEIIGFWINLSAGSDKYLDTITSGILYYINNNQYIRENSELYTRERKKILSMITEKMSRIDSSFTKSQIPFTSVGSENAGLVRTFTAEYINLLEKKGETEQEIRFGSKISIVDEYVNKIYRVSSLSKSIILYGIGIGIIGLFISLLIESIRLVRIRIRLKKGG